MKTFEALALNVEMAWKNSAYSLDAFPAIATQLLQEFTYSLSITELNLSLAEWLVKHSEIPDQINVHNTFGQPPLTLFNNGRFVVDLYIWVNFDTSIHTHGFRGAFKVLHGYSLHEVFQVNIQESLAQDLALTELSPPDRHLLSPRDVRTILPGNDLTHRVIHLENPTVTLCVKTINEPELVQWHHFPNGLAIQKRQIAPGNIKKVYYYQYLVESSDHESSQQIAAKFLEKFTSSLDISTQMNLCEDISSGVLNLSENTSQAILDAILAKHEDQEWFEKYVAAGELYQSELNFENSNSSLHRLLAHLINERCASAEFYPLISELVARTLDVKESQTESLPVATIKAALSEILAQDGDFAAHLDATSLNNINAFATERFADHFGGGSLLGKLNPRI